MDVKALLAKLKNADDFAQVAEVIGELKAEASRIRAEIQKREGSR